MVRTIEEINKLIKEGKEKEITKEEWEAIQGLIDVLMIVVEPIQETFQELADFLVKFIDEHFIPQ